MKTYNLHQLSKISLQGHGDTKKLLKKAGIKPYTQRIVNGRDYSSWGKDAFDFVTEWRVAKDAKNPIQAELLLEPAAETPADIVKELAPRESDIGMTIISDAKFAQMHNAIMDQLTQLNATMSRLLNVWEEKKE